MKKIKTIPFTAIFFVLIVSSLECAGRVFSSLGNDSKVHTYFKVRTFFFINFKSVLPLWTILIRNLLLHRILSAVNFQLHFQ